MSQNKLLAHLRTYLPTRSLTYLLTNSLTYSLTHVLTYSLNHVLTHLLSRIYVLTHVLTYLLTYLIINFLNTHLLAVFSTPTVVFTIFYHVFDRHKWFSFLITKKKDSMIVIEKNVFFYQVLIPFNVTNTCKIQYNQCRHVLLLMD